jgi:hypothetical protein
MLIRYSKITKSFCISDLFGLILRKDSVQVNNKQQISCNCIWMASFLRRVASAGHIRPNDYGRSPTEATVAPIAPLRGLEVLASCVPIEERRSRMPVLNAVYAWKGEENKLC